MITLYTYACVDRIVRTRCGRHMQRTGPHAVDPNAYRTDRGIINVQRDQPADRCLACYYQQGLDHHDD